jgi:hypothetical protein
VSPAYAATEWLCSSGRGEIGRRTGLRSQRREACEFESHRPHHPDKGNLTQKLLAPLTALKQSFLDCMDQVTEQWLMSLCARLLITQQKAYRFSQDIFIDRRLLMDTVQLLGAASFGVDLGEDFAIAQFSCPISFFFSVFDHRLFDGIFSGFALAQQDIRRSVTTEASPIG